MKTPKTPPASPPVPPSTPPSNPFAECADRTLLWSLAAKWVTAKEAVPELSPKGKLVASAIRRAGGDDMRRQMAMLAALILDEDFSAHMPPCKRYALGMPVVAEGNDNQHDYPTGQVCFLLSTPFGYDRAVKVNGRIGNHLPGSGTDAPGVRLATREEVLAALKEMGDEAASFAAAAVCLCQKAKSLAPDEEEGDGEPDFMPRHRRRGRPGGDGGDDEGDLPI